MAAKKAVYTILDLKGNVITGLGAPSLDTDAATKASAQAQATAAQTAAITAAAADATTKASAAKTEAIAAAALDATTKANAAQAAAISSASADATTKANAAQAAAELTAKNYTDGEITKLINNAPETLNTLGEIATALSTEGAVGSILAVVADKTNIATATITGTGTPSVDGVEYNVTHNLNKTNVLVQAFDGNDQVDVFVRKVNANSLKVITGAALGSTTLSVVVVG